MVWFLLLTLLFFLFFSYLPLLKLFYMINNTICCVLNYAPHYRLSIYLKIQEHLNCHFYFGSKLQTNIKKIDYSKLYNVNELKSIWFFNKVYVMVGLLNLLFKPYKKYLITGQTNCLSNWIFIPLARLMGKEVYIWNHGWYGKETYFKKIIKKFFYIPVSGFFLYGEYAKNLMIKEGFKENKLKVVYNSLDFEKTKKIRKTIHKTNLIENYFSNKQPTIIFIGRLQKNKKLEMLITFLKEQQLKGQIYNLILIGDGNNKFELLRQVHCLQLEKQVWFFGACYDEYKIAELIFNADVCVSPGNVGLTAIHALSYGTPVITNNDFSHQMPEFEAIIPNLTGDFFIKDSIQSMNESIENWIKLYPRKTEDLIKNCYTIIDEKYNIFYQIKIFKETLLN